MEYLLDWWGVEALELKQEINSTLFSCLKTNVMTTHEAPHIGHIIKAELKRQGRSVAWLASQIGYTRQNTYHLLERGFIYTDLLLKISDLLDFDFFKCYTEYRKANRLSKNI